MMIWKILSVVTTQTWSLITYLQYERIRIPTKMGALIPALRCYIEYLRPGLRDLIV